MVTMSCNMIKGCNKRQNEFFKCNSGFGKYKERKAKSDGKNRKKEAGKKYLK
jgi:hypothetical protein